MRPVSPWTWRRLLRDHGPKSTSVLLTLYTIGTYMKRDGCSYPSQELIAKGARASVRTVQRHIAAAQRDGWLGVQLAGRGGKGWRYSVYRAAAPDHLPLEELDEKIADHVLSIEGGIEGGDTAMSSARSGAKSQHDRSTWRPPADDDEGRDDNGSQDVATNDVDGDDKQSTTWRHPDVVLTPALRTPALRTHAKREAHADASAPFSSSEKREPEGSTTKPQLQTSTSFQRVVQGKDFKRPARGWVYSAEELTKNIKKLHDAGCDVATIEKNLMQYSTYESIRRVLFNEYGIQWCSV